MPEEVEASPQIYGYWMYVTDAQLEDAPFIRDAAVHEWREHARENGYIVGEPNRSEVLDRGPLFNVVKDPETGEEVDVSHVKTYIVEGPVIARTVPHCNHWQTGDANCCACGRTNWYWTNDEFEAAREEHSRERSLCDRRQVR